ncbi:hypothetical protein E4T56_gene11570 [Termitomyces sp. T112]|nr:hypothetical protein E4T56_gene11570 [Termitomyces sp. T112]KAH0581385.1 hypothetical protein H2248_012472 [Termitomyces sp. 'cryptogamus']KNZ72457.1 hypothetical protein J132_02968 [Termitomyces sp. J132]
MSGIVATPPPWDLKCRTWTFLVSGLTSTSSFPAGFADPDEADILASDGEFIGTPGLVMIVSYTDTPVGPYDELIYIPGKWKYKDGTAGYRITRIYVSSKESTENGRRNWNIPKHVANFSITTSNEESTIKVFHLGATEPFFHAKTQPVTLLSKIPIPLNTSIFGNFLSLAQPPLPATKSPEDVGTSQWATVAPAFSGNVYAERIIPQLDGRVGDGKGFPAIVPWSLGLYAPKMEGIFGFAAFADSK